MRWLRYSRVSNLIAISGIEHISTNMEDVIKDVPNNDALNVMIQAHELRKKFLKTLLRVGISEKMALRFVELSSDPSTTYFPRKITDQEVPGFFGQLGGYVMGHTDKFPYPPDGVILYHEDSGKISRWAALRKCIIDTERILTICEEELPGEINDTI